MIKISVTIITYNEEKNIERCLKSVETIADELIIVDSFSSDKTEKIARKFNIHFIQNKFEGHIEQKNFAITQAKHNYILSLDADEVLSPKLLELIKEVKNNWQYDAYYFNRLNNFCGKWIKYSGWYPDKKLRLWDKRKAKWGGTNPHDTVVCQADCTKKYLKADLLHYSFYSIKQHVEQINKFSQIGALALHKKGEKSSLFLIVFSPIFMFIKTYFIKLGFLDGFYGFIIAVNSAHAKFLKYTKLRELEKNCN